MLPALSSSTSKVSLVGRPLNGFLVNFCRELPLYLHTPLSELIQTKPDLVCVIFLKFTFSSRPVLANFLIKISCPLAKQSETSKEINIAKYVRYTFFSLVDYDVKLKTLFKTEPNHKKAKAD